jgi:epoxyqueuosine reductase
MKTSISDTIRPDAGAGTIRDAIATKARAEGFDTVGFTSPGAVAAAARRLAEFLAAGRHGDMDWLARGADRRADPRVLWPDARSVVVVGQSYAPDHDPLDDLGDASRGAISVYARSRDYHQVLKKRLRQLGRWTTAETGAGVKVFVDTAPLMEKPLAAAAGLGWQGKHTNLVARDFGSWLFLGAMLTTLDLAPDRPHQDRCGSCRACLDICPTGAFPAPYQLDARRCISYLTIEHRGHIAREWRTAIGNRIFGCDDCLAVCPWNKFAARARDNALHARAELTLPALRDLARLDDKAFRALFAGTSVKRTGRDRFVRNVMIAIGNCGDRALMAEVEARLDDASPLVRAMAAWALGRLAAAGEVRAAAERHLAHEADPAVRAEWNAAIDGAPA